MLLKTVRSHLFFALLFIAPTAFAQWSVGMRTGMHQNFVKANKPFKAEENHWSWHIGIFAEVPVARQLYFAPGFQVSFRKYDVNVFTREFSSSYVEIPLMLSYQPVRWVNLEIGPYVSFKVSPPSGDSDLYPDAAFSKWMEAGIAGGVCFNVTSTLSIVPRYGMALVPIVDTALYDETQQHLGDLKLYTRTLQISLAWKPYHSVN